MEHTQVADLIDHLDNESWYIRHNEAVAPLVKVGSPALPALLEAFETKPHRKATIAYILYQIDPSKLDQALSILIEDLRLDDNWGFGEAVWALGEMGSSARSLVPSLIDILRDNGAKTGARIGAAKALWHISVPVEMILSAFLQTLKDNAADIDIRTEAAYGCVKLGGSTENVVPEFIDALRDSHWWIRLYAVRFLSQMGKTSRAAIPHLCESLHDEDYNVRRNSAYALAQMEEAAQDAIPDLIPTLGDEDIAGVASEALARIGPEALPALMRKLKALEGPSAQYAAYAIECMENVDKALLEQVANIFTPTHANFYLPEPRLHIDEQKRVEFDQILQYALGSDSSNTISYTSKHPKHEFLWYLTSYRGLLIHGSNRTDMDILQPMQAAGDEDDENSNAVYATEKYMIPMYFSLVNRDKRLWGLSNAQFSIKSGDRVDQEYYYLSINAESLREGAWTNGMVYILPRETFKKTNAWISDVPVTPLAKLPLAAEDFPFSDYVTGFDVRQPSLGKFDELGIYPFLNDVRRHSFRHCNRHYS